MLVKETFCIAVAYFFAVKVFNPLSFCSFSRIFCWLAYTSPICAQSVLSMLTNAKHFMTMSSISWSGWSWKEEKEDREKTILQASNYSPWCYCIKYMLLGQKKYINCYLKRCIKKMSCILQLSFKWTNCNIL